MVGEGTSTPPPGLVGRDDTLTELRGVIEHAVAGSPAVVLVTGETGVGKTALVRELAALPTLTVLYGGCLPVEGDPLPFAPLVQALRRLGDAPALRRQQQRSPELARLLPGWTPTEAADAEAGSRSSSQLALFQGVLELVERLGVTAPVLLAVEDVHWADRSTLDLLRFLATNLALERVVLLVTYRVDEVRPGSPLATWLAELARLPITRRIGLQRLTEDDATTLLRRLTDDTDPVRVRAALERSDGNPLYLEHLARQGLAVASVPTTLRELLQARIAALDQRTRDLLQVLAVLGRPASLELLASVLDVDAEAAEPAAREALSQFVLEVRADEALGFTHPAFGEVVYADLLGSQRGRLHRRAAEVLHASPGARPQELARHWLAAGERERALVASVAAAGAAEDMYAFGDAHDGLVRAADLATELGQTWRRRVLLARAAQAAYLAGASEDAIRLAGEALDAPPGPHSDEATLHERLGVYHFVSGHGPEAEAAFLRALAEVEGRPPTAMTARVYAGLAMLASGWSRLEEAEDWCARGLAAARAVGARREEGLVHNALGMVASIRGEVTEAIEQEQAALAIARDAGGADDLALAYVNLTHVLGQAGRLDEVAQVASEGGRLLTRRGLASQFGALLSANACEALVDAGRLDDAEALVRDSLAHPAPGIMAAPQLIQAARVALARGELELAWERGEEARLALEVPGAPDAWRRTVNQVQIEVELWSGRSDAAYELVLDALREIAGTDEEPHGGVLVAFGLRALADQAERHRDQRSAQRIAGLRAPLDQAARVAPGGSMPLDGAVRAWQDAERERAERRSSARSWTEVGERWRAAGVVPAAAYAGWREAEARLDAGVDAQAIDVVRRGHAEARAHGLGPVAAELERLAGWHRIDLVEAPQTGADDAAGEALDAYGLTERELEVLSSLAAGRTNREIAEELFISVKTASVHVSNILRKLDVSGRQEAARVAHRLGVR